jgi:phosphate transport system substrate-binding protein
MALATLTILAVAGTPVFAADVKIGAGAAPTENVFKKIAGPLEKATGVRLVIVDSGPAQALKDLDKGLVEAAAGGVTFADWMAMMEKEGYPIKDRAAYKNRVIGKDVIQVIANKDSGVKTLTKDQLKGIFTGAIKNWKEVGGVDKPIVVFLGSKIPGTQSVFQKQAMDGAAYTTAGKEGTTAEDLKAKVIATPGATCLAPAALVDGAVAAPAMPEVGRPITLITKGEPTGALITVLDYIRGPGRAFIEK